MRSTFLLVLLCCVASAQAAPFTLYVSPEGNDNWSGTLEAPDAAGTDGHGSSGSYAGLQ